MIDMETLDHLTFLVVAVGTLLTLYFGRGAARSSRALDAETMRPKPWSTSSSAEQAYRLRESELRRTFRRRVLCAAASGGSVLLSVLLRTTINRPVHHEATTVARPHVLSNMTSEDAGILIFMSWFLVAAAGLFLFFVVRSLYLTAIAQRNRKLERGLIVRGAFRLSSYDEQGRRHLRRAGAAGLFSLVALVAFLLVAKTLQYVQ